MRISEWSSDVFSSDLMEIVSLDLPFWSPEVLLILFAQGLVFWKVGLYRGVWRFASLPDLLNILKASLAGLLAIVLALFLYNSLELVPRSVLALYPILLTGSEVRRVGKEWIWTCSTRWCPYN